MVSFDTNVLVYATASISDVRMMARDLMGPRDAGRVEQCPQNENTSQGIEGRLVRGAASTSMIASMPSDAE
jgi:hypothetical protein